METKKSWNNQTNLDCFENGNPKTIEHIWPTSLGGSNSQINKMYLSTVSNASITNKTKGRIGQYRWSKVKATTKEGVIYGKLMIRHDSEEDKTKWIEIIPVL